MDNIIKKETDLIISKSIDLLEVAVNKVIIQLETCKESENTVKYLKLFYQYRNMVYKQREYLESLNIVKSSIDIARIYNIISAISDLIKEESIKCLNEMRGSRPEYEEMH